MPFLPLDLDGYTDLPPGRIANMVTYLEMRTPPASPRGDRPDLRVRRIERPETASYRQLYSRIGERWLWFSRAVMPEEELRALLSRPDTETRYLEDDTGPIGLSEIHVGRDDVEIAMFGVVPEAAGRGAAAVLMDATLAAAWRPGIERVWLHTCSFDSPAALPFYAKSGFRPYKFAVEVSPDPRLTGHLPRSAGPHIPLIEPEERS
ncbi:GNAT family N-acetyltransferase [Prosthecomicrobium pneumaticum]|uniref:GNAT superfamily N-acetyltransferase n=1 Tax=Prosthecomicrobium pneumaticum TaxID=81895 RepID=A0A7W9FKE2_9HYPH|nr:GNAT family N-acetyltransferase [Prosthecomicrobium pneumaticum]MBB5752667.1 GNAT superfamily N-acetyltransferase [Prosthecomicrobium pneumaticum]